MASAAAAPSAEPPPGGNGNIRPSPAPRYAILSLMKVIAFNGSARKDGNTAILLRYVLAELEKEGIETELVQLSGQKIHGCLACRTCATRKDGRCGQTDDMGNQFIEQMVAADGILLGSPTYVA